MLDTQTRGAILVLRRKGHSLHRISQLLSLSRNTVKKVIKIGSDVPPVIHRLRKLDAHHELIAQMLAEFDGSVVKVCRVLSDARTSVGYSTLTRFCRKNHLLDGARAPRHSVMATRDWLLELARGTYAGERFQSQLPHTTDLQFLLSKLKHGRSRDRKKAATILARKRGISNSLIAKALLSSRKTTRQYYNTRCILKPDRKSFSPGIRVATSMWKPTISSEQNASSKSSTISQPPLALAARIGRTPHSALLNAYEQSYGETISRCTLVRILRRAGFRWRKARRVLALVRLPAPFDFGFLVDLCDAPPFSSWTEDFRPACVRKTTRI